MSRAENDVWVSIGCARDNLSRFLAEVGAEDLRRTNPALPELQLRVGPLLKTVRDELDRDWDAEELLLTQDLLRAVLVISRNCGTIRGWLANEISNFSDPDRPSDLRGTWEELQRGDEVLSSALKSRTDLRRAASGGKEQSKKTPKKRGPKFKYDAKSDRRLVQRWKLSNMTMKDFVAKGQAESVRYLELAKGRVRKQKKRKAE